MSKRRLFRILQLRYNPLRQGLAKLDPPLIERIDVPDGALGEHAVLVERYQLPEIRRRELVRKNRIGRAVAFENTVRNQPIRRTLGFHLLRRLPEGQRLGLRENVGQQYVMMASQRIERLPECDEVARDQP